MTKPITDYLPQPEPTETVLVQADLPADLHREVVAQFQSDRSVGIKMTWKALIEGACRQYLEAKVPR